mgnify:FL=1
MVIRNIKYKKRQRGIDLLSLRFVASLILLLMVFAGNPLSLAGELPPSESRDAAQESLRSFLEAIPDSDLHYFSLSKSDLPRTSVGRGFRLNTITPPVLEQMEEGADVARALTKAPVFLFPVVVDDQLKALLTVEKRENRWETISIGGAGVAREWETITRNWDTSVGFDHDFIRIYQAVADLVLVTPPPGFSLEPNGQGEDGSVIVLMDSAKMALSTQNQPLISQTKAYPPGVIMELLKARVRKSIEHFEGSEDHQVLD